MDYFDRFSIFFTGDKLIAGRRTYWLGEITTELLNLKNEWFVELQKCADNFVPAAREMLANKNEKAAPDVQEQLNAVWDLLLELPPYRNNIAPGEATRTCRKVGAHNKAEREKASETPAQREYRKAYNRLKVRKARGKISSGEWNEKVAQAQEWKDLAEQGRLPDSELREKLASL